MNDLIFRIDAQLRAFEEQLREERQRAKEERRLRELAECRAEQAENLKELLETRNKCLPPVQRADLALQRYGLYEIYNTLYPPSTVFEHLDNCCRVRNQLKQTTFTFASSWPMTTI